MSEIASLNPSDTLDTVAKFHRLMEKEGVPWERFQLAINNKTARRNLAEYLNMGCPKVKEGQAVALPANDYDLARTILGNDFISPEEVAEKRKLIYTDEQLQHFAETLPSEEMLGWFRVNGFVLIAGPPTPMSLLNICDLNNQLFYSKSEGWYANDNQKFSRNDKVTAKWLVLREKIVPNSANKNWDEQQKLLSEEEYVPNAAELCWGITTYKEVHNFWLLPDIYARTSSVGADGGRVLVGGFDGSGLCVLDYLDDARDDGLGVASARK